MSFTSDVEQGGTYLVEAKQNYCSHVDIAGGELRIRKVILDPPKRVTVERCCFELKILAGSLLCNVCICSRQNSLAKTGTFGISSIQIRKKVQPPVTDPRARMNNIVMKE